MSEKTEAKLISDYQFLTARIKELGAQYTPPNSIAELAKMQSKLSETVAGREKWQTADAEEETARNSREDLMRETLPVFAETVTYGKSLLLDQNDLDALAAVNRVLQGRRASNAAETAPENGQPPTPKRRHSSAKTSYASRADKAAEFVELLRANPQYRATDEKFRIDTFDARIDALQTANSTVAEKEAAAQNQRTALDTLLYLDGDCLVNSANSAKNYIKSRFTTKHPVWNQIRRMEFRIPTRLRTKAKK